MGSGSSRSRVSLINSAKTSTGDGNDELKSTRRSVQSLQMRRPEIDESVGGSNNTTNNRARSAPSADIVGKGLFETANLNWC